ncbi:hypothetical protein SteCoe_12470 [Stentor coeruleus]|uniref:Uncharacterized protein n=1 Tax=Stentor coeruleus TaxID=5963 RepID=A0A1R2CAU3_9CILI|nr:hypothetical protein SteCoe_12470 [Stentor coeruleus]
MSRLIQILQKFNFIDSSIQESDIEPTVPVFNSTQELPKDTFFVTSRIVLIPYPKEELINSLAGYFNTMHFRKYMVWNLSETLYSADIFNGQVLDFVFVGYPNPPLSSIFGIFNSISGWLESDPDNIAVIHCQSTRARSFMMISSYLAWQNHKDPIDIYSQLSKNFSQPSNLLFPSHYRYMNYINQVTQGFKPHDKTLFLKKVIINGLPLHLKVFKPYIQFFHSGKMIFSSFEADKMKTYTQNDESVCFDVNLEIKGDIIFRCRNNSEDKMQTVLRAMFHTAFTDDYILRLYKNDLDAVSEHFSDEFMVDLFFTSKEGTNNVVPGNLKKRRVKKTGDKNIIYEGEEEEEEEKIDRELIEKYKTHIEDSDEEEEEDLDDYFQKLEAGK